MYFPLLLTVVHGQPIDDGDDESRSQGYVLQDPDDLQNKSHLGRRVDTCKGIVRFTWRPHFQICFRTSNTTCVNVW